MIDEQELAAALNRAYGDFDHFNWTKTGILEQICKTLQEISCRDLLWTFHEDSYSKFRVERINYDRKRVS